MKKYIDSYRRAINPPYTGKDARVILGTLGVLVLMVALIVFGQQERSEQVGAASINLQSNPSFEQQSGEFPIGWQIRTNLVWDGTTAHSGIASLKAVGPADGYTFSRGLGAMSPNTTYTISVWIKTQDVTTARGVTFRFPDLPVVGSPNVKGTSDWTLVSNTFKTPATFQSGRLDLWYQLNQGAIAWFDDVTVCEGSRVDCDDTIAAITPTVPTLPTPTTVPPTPTTAPSVPTNTPTPTPDIIIQDPTTPQSTLLASYIMRKPAGTGNVPYGGNLYFPRQFKTGSVLLGIDKDYKIIDSGAYNGWDFYAGVPSSNLADAVTLHLNRPATLAVVWRAGSDNPLPNWLSTANNWIPSGTINAFPVVYTYQPNKGISPVYKKSFPAGKVVLGGLVNPGESVKGPAYWVLLAEEGGQPSQTPLVAQGLPVPETHKPCPTWVHDQYMTAGPDGKPYRTWHSIVDPVYWCTFGHEHGANPKLIADNYINALEYTAQKHGMVEGHPGFKNLIFDTNGYRWLFNLHIGTAGRGRLCVRYHTVEIAVKDSTGNVVADLRFMGDFGRAISNNNAPGTGKLPLTPDECPDQDAKAKADGSGGKREIPVESIPDTVLGYEPWTVDLSKTVFGFLDSRDLKSPGIFLVNQYDVIKFCDTLICPFLKPNSGPDPISSATGVTRYYQGATLALIAGHKGEQYTGHFCTDPLGRTFIPYPCKDNPMAIEQYIKPGLRVFNGSNGAMDHESFGRLWFDRRGAQSANREKAIIPGVGPN